ncbi:MAG TPA: prenyltransferase/squalene oxidase repeat-containing protein [Planctomycetota bacterium]|nr:prenyltransferase/squalene oxidase repeat-containing protein [Planctomycetota bacterium]
MRDDELLERHLNGDLDGPERESFLARLQESPELRRKLASRALEETLIAEVVREGRVVSTPPRRVAWPAVAAAALMLAVLSAALWYVPRRRSEPASSAEKARIDQAVGRACRYLEQRRQDLFVPLADGKRHSAPPRRIYAELAALALLRAGYPESHPLVGECLSRALGRPLESTYVAALQARFGRPDLCRRVAQFLADTQCANGQWDYGRAVTVLGPPPEGRIRRRADGPASGDNSVSSYAIQGLLACRRAGVEVEPDILVRANRWWRSCQNADGGWGYAGGTAEMTEAADTTSASSYGSATAAGVSSLAALRELIGPDSTSDAAIARGTSWLAAHFAVQPNPGKAAGFCQAHWLSAAGRAGTLLRQDRFGAHDWYAEGSAFLLSAQEPDGAWRLEQGKFMTSEKNDVIDTCLAVLFLLRD